MTQMISRRMMIGGFGALGGLGGLGLAALIGGSLAGATPAELSGHWRKTFIQFEQPVDENLIFNADGTLEAWQVTAGGQTPRLAGRWSADGASVTLSFEGSPDSSLPYALFEGRLVLPNIQGQRGFWERVG